MIKVGHSHCVGGSVSICMYTCLYTVHTACFDLYLTVMLISTSYKALI